MKIEILLPHEFADVWRTLKVSEIRMHLIKLNERTSLLSHTYGHLIYANIYVYTYLCTPVGLLFYSYIVEQDLFSACRQINFDKMSTL